MTDIVKPYIGPSAMRLTELINATNPGQPALTEGIDFLYGLPVESSQAQYNTRVRLQDIRQNKVSDRDIHYNRLSLAVLGELPPGFISSVYTEEYEFTTHSIINQINFALGLDLTTDEVVNTAHVQGKESYPLVITPGASLAWLDNTVFNYSVVGGLRPLDDVYKKTDLDGLYPPAKVVKP